MIIPIRKILVFCVLIFRGPSRSSVSEVHLMGQSYLSVVCFATMALDVQLLEPIVAQK